MSIDFKRVHANQAPEPTDDVEVVQVERSTAVQQRHLDEVTVEEPLEIRLGFTLLGKPAQRSISVTMRTPGDDEALACGFLFGESIISGVDDIDNIEYCSDNEANSESAFTNIIRVAIAPGVDVDMASVQRNFYTTSSCGVCGKASLEALEIGDAPVLDPHDFTLSASTVTELPDRLRRHQPIFERTGGIHAAGLFDDRGTLLTVHEDVGRHNAMDKLVGARLLDGQLPLTRSIAVLSGRASFELLQKALRAQIPVVVAVGAPSSLAVDLADHFGITLIGFAKKTRFNVYSHPQRIDRF